MRKNYLTKYKPVLKNFAIKDFNSITAKNINIFAGESLIGTNLTKKIFAHVISGIITSYIVNGQMYLYCENKKIYLFHPKSEVLELVFSCKSQPVLTSIIVNGEKKVLVIESDRTSVIGLDGEFGTAIYGDCTTSYKGKVFVGKGAFLYISNPIDFATNTMNASPLNTITFSNEDGNVLGLIEQDDYLLVVCEKAFYKLETDFGKDYTLEKFNVGDLSVVPNSLSVVDGKLYFISGQKICSFYKGVVKKHTTIYDDHLSTFSDKAQGYNQYYMVQIMIGESQHSLLFDTITNRCFIMDSNGEGLMGGAYTYAYETHEFKIICADNYDCGRWASKKLTFLDNRKKAVYLISLFASKPCKLTLSGAFGQKTFDIKKGCNNKRVNLISHDFTLEVQVENPDFYLRDLSLQYRIMED